MKLRWLVGVLAGVVMAGSAAAQTTPQGQVPAGDAALGSVSLPRSVMADGKALKAGTYQVRLTAQQAQPDVAGQQMERWVEFVQGGKVQGREVVSIVPASELKDLNSQAKGPKPASGATRVEMLKGDEYLRVWINNRGVNYLLHMPPAKKG
jgi:hypothetical protein